MEILLVESMTSTVVGEVQRHSPASTPPIVAYPGTRSTCSMRSRCFPGCEITTNANTAAKPIRGSHVHRRFRVLPSIGACSTREVTTPARLVQYRDHASGICSCLLE